MSKIQKTKTEYLQMWFFIILVIGMLANWQGVMKNYEPEQAKAGEIPVEAGKEDVRETLEPLRTQPKEVESTPQTENDDKGQVEAINTFLKENNSPLVGYGQQFVDIAKKYGYHPFTAVSIAYADTSLGKNLTTPFNIGNVGNSDSCPTCGTHTKSWEQGIESIYQTLSNKYLGKATKLCHLSQGGWKDCPEGSTINGGNFYASSLANWHRNSTYAFSWLLGTPMNYQINIKL